MIKGLNGCEDWGSIDPEMEKSCSSLYGNPCPCYWGKRVFFLWMLAAVGSRMVNRNSKANVSMWRNLLTDNCLFSSVNSSWGWGKRLPDRTIQQLYVASVLYPNAEWEIRQKESRNLRLMLQTVVLWGCKSNTARRGQALSLAIKTCKGK